MKPIGLFLLLWVLCLSPPLQAAPATDSSQSGYYGNEVTSHIGRYQDYELSAGPYETYEVTPLSRLLFKDGPVPRNRGITHVTGPDTVRVRRRLADSHAGIKFYSNLSCKHCHGMQAMDIHTVRLGISCAQCHGAEPIASGDHYYSPMNPIRRHAYVCGKCHQGAGASFAKYVVHEPNPMASDTMQSFPALFWAFWIMVGITIATFALFLPHTLLWVFRELVQGLSAKRKGG